MMKKVFMIGIVLLLCMLLGATSVKAIAESVISVTDAVMTIQAPTTITEGEKIITANITLGKITASPELTTGETVPMGYEADIEYDTNIVESISVKPLNGWSCQIANKRIVADTTAATENTPIAELTITLKENVPAETKVNVQFKNFNISDGADLDKTLSLSIATTIEAKATTNENTTNNVTVNEVTNTTNNETKNESTTTNTTVKKGTLPKAGKNGGLIIMMIVLAIAGILGFIRYHSIKVK